MKRVRYVSLICSVVVALGALAATIAGGWAPKLGLDLAGGSEIVYKPSLPGGGKVGSQAISETIDILRNRVDGAGVGGAEIDSQGGNIIVQLPNINDPATVENIIGETAQMQFRPVLCGADAYTAPAAGSHAPTAPPWPPACSASQYDYSATNLQTTSSGPGATPPNDPVLASYPTSSLSYNNANPTQPVLLPIQASSGASPSERLLLGPSGMTGKGVASASAQFTAGSTGWQVAMSLKGSGIDLPDTKKSGSAEWDALASAQFHAEIAVDLDGQVISAPVTQQAQASFSSFDGQVSISGGFTESQAKQLALQISYGALPVTLNKLTAEHVSPTLGKASLKAGLLAGIGGLLLVLIYTIFYYRILGVVVFAGLSLTAGLLWSIVAALGHTGLAVTLDLSGVTGLIVSVGITVDSYIVYFERLKDEARGGRTIRSTVERSFKGAFRTVLAADLVSLTAAVVLYLLSVGSVRGFAFFLGLSTFLDIGATYFFTRPLVIWLGRQSNAGEGGRLNISSGLAVDSGGAA